jgi:hypothetical protein
MAKAQFTYAVGLVADEGMRRRPTFNNALNLLKDFLSAHDGEYLGPFRQDFKDYPEYAVVKMSRATENALQDFCVAALYDPDQKPFVERLEGEFFDIGLAEGMEVGICTLDRPIVLRQPI